MSAPPEPRGRLIVVTGGADGHAAAVGRELAGRFEAAVAVDLESFDDLVVSGRVAYDGTPGIDQIRQLFLRWSAGIATAETYQLEGFEAVLADPVVGARLEDFIDLVAPEPIHLVVLDDGSRPTTALGITVPDIDADAAVDAILPRLTQSAVVTETQES